jgi:hypothetical protein
MNYHIRNPNIKMEYIDRDKLPVNFEDRFNMEKISSEKIQFARHYLENIMGLDLHEDPLIVFSPIGSKIFGFLVADIVLEYENYKEETKDG